MALVPVKIHLPLELLPEEEKTLTIEDQLPTVDTVFSPLLRFYNDAQGVNMRFKITHILDLGFGDDPLNSGTFTFSVVDEVVAPNTFRDYEFTPQIDNDQQVVTRHVVSVENLSTTEKRIVRMILFGQTEVSAQLPAGQMIIKAQ